MPNFDRSNSSNRAGGTAGDGRDAPTHGVRPAI
jgi:hypothetical protein